MKNIILLLLLLTNMHSYSQELFKKELHWEPLDSIEKTIFNDKKQIIEWSKTQLPFSTTYPKDLIIKDYNIYIVMVAGCSGLPCWNIYIFKEQDELWQLKIYTTQARLKEQIKIEVDNKQEKIIFKTKSGQIGEVPFETLNISFDKTEQ
ncbi:MAG: hypothetical protein ABFS10_06920 [Bacteroidota bacterium]